ncbi:MAG: NAD(P)/FAD-dependent oxidoreductase [Smithellaceae bacterium]|nr:NAD(P)/FAD-dependent oxidoreductase [Smithellaceae bacterium]MDD3259357.1 NAD(P)/FAD-dependent oxidoreductase [Smithellaceae bacterium]MDD3849443.1 NAD(P)/FAD-dependent oxidoreductase [Smithellaceae bacterium]HOQ72659.1 NAD(P)/FAD-dependent oxidoreductase [Smithellaceae bacterium]HPL10004.1 NAD(P)/FAD-dependent oxidoreductase [Smithellaceae bacterium]
MSENYDLIVIGGGPGGLAAAQTASAANKRVLIIERGGWGGTCTHRGCIPTKAMLACSRFYADLKKLKRVGVNVSGGAVDFAAMKKHRDQMVRIAALGAQKMIAGPRVESKIGLGEILSPREVRCTGEDGVRQFLKTEKILIAWGSKPQILPGLRASERIRTSDEILSLEQLPSSIIIVGGSFIGVEYATLFAELGVRVTLVELMDRILPREDEEAAELLGQELARLGVVLHTSTRLVRLEESGEGVKLSARKNGEDLEIQALYALLCTGRAPVLHADQLDSLGVDFTNAGIRVDKRMMTSVGGIYAAGDVTGGMMLAHRASLQAKVAVEGMFGGSRYRYDEDLIPSVVYSHPQIARVGLTERRALDEGLEISVVRSDYGANLMARAELMGQGFVKIIFHREVIAGAVAAGDHAAELLAPLALAVSGKWTRRQFRSWVLPHPTLGEVFAPLAD